MLVLRHLKEKKRIQQGVALLDRQRGPGWVNDIDLGSLDIGDRRNCVLGQLYGRYEYGMFAKGLSTHSVAREYGFYDRFGRYDSLNKKWIKLIKKEQLARSA